MLFVYALTLFLSALLLFLVEPLIGKLIVPLLGGFPAVWNTCMVFFQAMLLAGYAYAHYSSNWLGERKQAAVHLALVALVAVLVLLFHLEVFRDLVPSTEGSTVGLVFGLLLLLLISVGPAFFAVSATAPLLQRWFANTASPHAKDPYFLYAASNVGSMLGLFGYIVAIEPKLTLVQQRWAWAAGYALLVLLLGVCAVLFWKAPAAVPLKEKEPANPLPPAGADAFTAASPLRRFATEFAGPSLAAQPVSKGDEDVTLGRALRWVALAFVPSSLMLGVTTYITTDIAAIPLLWVLPLALYLLSFILVFSNLPAWVHKFTVLGLPVLLLLLVFLLVSHLHARMWTVILLHLLVLFAVAMVCHGELARSRPAPSRLTQFYLLMSLGGVLGGLFNALLAPLLFTTTAEYPLALALAALLIPRLDEPAGTSAWRSRWLDFLLPAVVGVVCLEFFGVSHHFPLGNGLLRLFDRAAGHAPGDAARGVVADLTWLAHTLHFDADSLLLILCYAPPVILAYVLVERPLRFGLGVAAILLVASLPAALDPSVIYRDRSFFGAFLVRSGVEDPVGDQGLNSHRLLHGRILHGKQFQDDEHRTLAITYYHETGPIGRLFAAFPPTARNDVAVIGLGTGTMAAYARPGQHYTFYEIDPKVKQLSFDQRTYFSYVQDAKARGAEVDIVLGDARLSLDRERRSKPDRKYDLIVVDAFSSDAIPVHLLTRQALQIYRDKLKEHGIIVFHTSNRYLDLEPVIANIAAAEEMTCLMMSDPDSPRNNPGLGKSDSTWVLVANDLADFGPLPEDTKHWERLSNDDRVGVWTDDYSNLLRVFRWKGED
jgi:SAM-dependent methyltransferase